MIPLYDPYEWRGIIGSSIGPTRQSYPRASKGCQRYGNISPAFGQVNRTACPSISSQLAGMFWRAVTSLVPRFTSPTPRWCRDAHVPVAQHATPLLCPPGLPATLYDSRSRRIPTVLHQGPTWFTVCTFLLPSPVMAADAMGRQQLASGIISQRTQV